ncbi:MAG: LCP family protein, partial [Clostridia bacterium]|nr:LCP family protein [Clostridia bacterium]
TQPAGAQLSLTDGLPCNRINILFLGLDALNDGFQRSDSMIIASLGKDDVRLVSLMRDTMVDIPGYGRGKLNSAYSHGGAELTMQVINQTFGMNITNYVAVDMQALVELIDAVGGVDIEVSANELEQLNWCAKNTFARINAVNPERYNMQYLQDRYGASPMEYSIKASDIGADGVIHLDGLYATGYSRIRKIDSDFNRTSRQRKVLTAVMNEMLDSWADPSLYKSLYAIYTNSIETNISVAKLFSIGLKALSVKDIQNHRLPENNNLQDNYSSLEIIDKEKNIQSLYKFLYE